MNQDLFFELLSLVDTSMFASSIIMVKNIACQFNLHPLFL